MKFIPRLAARRLRELLRIFPAVVVLGPRQSGKSTLVRHALPRWGMFDLERPTDAAALASDPEGWFDAHPARVVIDEAQRLPQLFSTLRYVIDRRRVNGRFVLLGSADPSLVRGVSESLAGRAGWLELTPFLTREWTGQGTLADRWFWGGFPPVLAIRRPDDRPAFFDAYLGAYLERDLPALALRLPAERLRSLCVMLTHVHGNLLSVSDLARSLAVSPPTVDRYLDVLESTFLIRRLRPFHANIGKRLTKAPKVYVRDSGLLHFLAGLRRPAELDGWPRRGASFEGLVIEELAARASLAAVRPGLWFWRTQAGAEVDLLIESGRALLPVEIKAGATISAASLSGLRHAMADLKLSRGWVVYQGSERREVSRGIETIPWADLASGKIELPNG